MILFKRPVAIALGLMFLAATALSTTGCTAHVQAADMMKGISATARQGKDLDSRFIGNTADFSMALFRGTVTQGSNSLICPLSVLLALAMTANGADQQTLAQMETVLGGDIPLAELNHYLLYYANSLPNTKKSKLTIANSIWFRDDEGRLQVEKNFLQTNADYYKSAAYKSAFDTQTLKDINNWVKANTDGMIDEILDEIHPDAVMYLINAIAFDAQWQTAYKKDNVFRSVFTAHDGSKQETEMMLSEEDLYLDDGMAKGFIKPYANEDYCFVALLPNPDISLQDYVQTLTGERFLQIIEEAEPIPVSASMPKFSYDYTIVMNDALKALGMPDAFSPILADFSNLGKSSRGNIFIGEVLHKTFISVDELGTKAGAVTKVEMRDEGYRETKIVNLDRPFIYAIIDSNSRLPIFIGTVVEINEIE